MTAGYSATPLYKKLNLRPDMSVLALDVPPDVRQIIDGDVRGISWVAQAKKVDAALLFVTSLTQLRQVLTGVRKNLQPTGFIWVSWPKKASGVLTDVTEDRVREIALSLKLVDVKVCAVTLVWSGLKLVIRIKDRK